jgi:amino acid permease
MDTSVSDTGAVLPVGAESLAPCSAADFILSGPIVHGINGFGQVFVLAAAYYVGTEIISLAAGETKDPRRSIPRV